MAKIQMKTPLVEMDGDEMTLRTSLLIHMLI